MKKLIKKILSYEIIRYSIWWWLAALLDLFLLWMFTDFFSVYYLLSAVFAFIISLSFGYFFQKYITFKDYSKKHISQWWLFLGFQLVWQWIYMFLLRMLVTKLWRYYMLVAIIAKLIVFVRNYVSNSLFNFKK